MAVVACVLLIFVVVAPTAVFTCYVVGVASNGKPTQSLFVEKMCDMKRTDVDRRSTKY
jgi:hypothetical protein